MNSQTFFQNDPKKQASYIKEQGKLHEIAAKNIIGGDAMNLNEIVTNFPTYDITSSTEIASVKSHMNSGTELSNKDINHYVDEFHEMIGWRKPDPNSKCELDPIKIQQDAQRIVEVRDAGLPIPSILRNAGQEEIGEYLKYSSSFRIPDDHVESVQKALEAHFREFPENYYLGSNPTDEQIKSMVNRVKGTGLNSAETLDQLVQEEGHIDEVSQDLTQHPSGEKITKSAGEIVGNAAGAPAGAETGKVAGKVASKAQTKSAETLGQSTESPTSAVKDAAKEAPANDASELDEEQYYGYSH